MIEPRVHEFPGGVYSADDEIRTDFNIEETNPLNGDPRPVALELRIISGQVVLAIVDMAPCQIEAIGMWLIEIAKEARNSYERLR